MRTRAVLLGECSASRRKAQTRSPWRRDSAVSPRACAAIGGQGIAVRRLAEQLAIARARDSAQSASSIPAASWTISRSGQYVIPRRTAGSGRSGPSPSPRRARNSATSRLLPTPPTEEREKLARPVVDGPVECLVEASELALSTDQRRVEAAGAALGAGGDVEQPVGRDRLGLALGVRSGSTASTTTASRPGVRRASDEDLAGRRGLLQASGRVDRVARDERGATGGVADDDLARVDAGAEARLEDPSPVLELLVQIGERGPGSRRPRERRAGRRPRGASGCRTRPSPHRR